MKFTITKNTLKYNMFQNNTMSKNIKDFLIEALIKYWPPILSVLISLGLSLINNELLWLKILIVTLPWFLFCLILYPFLMKNRQSEITKLAESKNKEMPENMVNLQKLTEDFLSNEEKWNNMEYSTVLKSICDTIRSFYVAKGGYTVGYDKFSVSIKEIQGKDNDRQIREICRDSSSTSVNRRIESLLAPYPLNENTPYQYIVDQYEKQAKADIFIETDVHEKIRKGDYKCTRSKKVGEENVPYKSVCVSPILPLVNPKSQNQIRGFICVDSEATGCFKKNDAANRIYHELASGILYKLLEVQDKCVNNK